MNSQQTPGRQKTGGRRKGTPNKSTGKMRDFLAGLLAVNMAQIKHDLKAVTPRDRLDFLAKILPYIVPKMQQLDADIKTDFATLTEAQINEIAQRVINGDPESESENI